VISKVQNPNPYIYVGTNETDRKTEIAGQTNCVHSTTWNIINIPFWRDASTGFKCHIAHPCCWVSIKYSEEKVYLQIVEAQCNCQAKRVRLQQVATEHGTRSCFCSSAYKRPFFLELICITWSYWPCVCLFVFSTHFVCNSDAWWQYNALGSTNQLLNTLNTS
jgi:hypothetical protein